MIQKYPVQIEELAEKFDVTGRTIRSDIKEINEFLSERELPLIQTVRRKGVEIDLTDEQKLQINSAVNKINIDYYSHSELRILNLILDFTIGEIHYVYEKQDEFKVSKSTLDNDMRTVRKILNDYHLSLNTNTSDKIMVVGSERAIRVMLFNTINKYLGPIDIYDAVKIETSLYQVLFQFITLDSFERVSNLYEQYIKYDDAMYKNQTVLFLLIWAKRLQNGDELSNEIADKNTQPADNIDLLINELKELFEIQVSQSERKYIRLILETLVSKSVKNPSQWTRGQIVTLELIDYVQKELNLQLNNQEELFSGLFKHIVKLISRLENNMQIRNPLTEEIKKNNPEIFKTIQSFDFDIDKNQTVQITDDEIAFIAIYFLVGISQDRQNYNYVYKAVVFCNHGKATGKLLAQMLEENFDIDVAEVLSSSELPLLNKIDADIAFSTIPLDLENIPLLVVDSLLIEQNYQKVENFLNLHANRRRKVGNNTLDKEANSQFFEDVLRLVKHSGGNVNEDIYNELKMIFHNNNMKLSEEAALPNIRETLKDDHILFDLKTVDWADAINQTALPLLKENIITESYIESMINSVHVNGPYIVMAPHMALAHAKPEDGVNEIGASVSRLESPVEFGHKENDPVKIIFSIAPVDSYTHINIMKDIFEIMNNHYKMQQLLECKSKEEFKKLLFN